MSGTITLKINFPDRKETKSLDLNDRTTVAVAKLSVAELTGTSIEDYSLFKPKSGQQPGIWLKEEDPLSYYDLDEAVLWRKHFRPLRILQLSGTFTTLLVNDTKVLSALTQDLLRQLGHKSCFSIDQIQGEESREILFPDMTLRDQ